MESTKRNNTMSDYIASLNAPIPAPKVSTADFDEANLFATTDFFNFDFADGTSTSETQQQDAKYQAWNAANSPDNLFSSDFQFNSATNTASSNNFAVAPSSTHNNNNAATAAAKRKHSELADPSSLPLEEHSRLAAEEDKRRRNTAASARFRVKKKQREQALEKTAKDMTDKATRLEKRVNELEMENRWLKGLITDKNEGEGDKLSEMFAKLKEEIGEKGLAALDS